MSCKKLSSLSVSHGEETKEKFMYTSCVIPRMGGKAYLANWLSGFIPEHITYVEPFAGGARLLFAKKPSPVEVLNDTDNNLVNLYRCIQNPEKMVKLISFLNETPYARSVFQSWKYGDETTQDDVEKAGRYYFLCKASFGGDVKRGGFALPSKGTGRNPAMTYHKSINALEHISKRLQGVTLECLDYKDCISRYDSSKVVFFVDPPYLNSEHYYGMDSFSQEDHLALAELLSGIKAGAMITHYQNSLYDELYKGWHRFEYSSFKGSHKSTGESKPVTREILYTNFEVKQKSLFFGN